jgi:hypothetical protein
VETEGQPGQPVVEQPEVSGEREQDQGRPNQGRSLLGALGAIGARIWGDDPDDSPAAEEPEPPTDEAPKPKPEPTPEPPPPAAQTPTEADIQERIRREAQSLKDKELRDERRAEAVQAADDGDLSKLVALAKRGDAKFAEAELTKRGATYELGEATAARVAAETADEAQNAHLTRATETVLPLLDDTYLVPLTKGLPDEVVRAIADGDLAAPGLDGRGKAVARALEAHRSQAAEEAVTKALNDADFAGKLLGSQAFRMAVARNEVARKQFLAYFRDQLPEPELNPGASVGAPLDDADFLAAYAAGNSNDHARARKLTGTR